MKSTFEKELEKRMSKNLMFSKLGVFESIDFTSQEFEKEMSKEFNEQKDFLINEIMKTNLKEVALVCRMMKEIFEDCDKNAKEIHKRHFG